MTDSAPNTNPGEFMDDMGITCAQLYRRFERVGAYPAREAMWDALQEFIAAKEKIEYFIPDEFGAET